MLGNCDTTRTVGCLRADYPLCLDLPQEAGVDDLLKSVKEQVRQMSQHSLSYGYLRAMDESLALKPALSFTYCPPLVDSLLSAVQVNTSDADSAGPLQLKTGIQQGQLEWRWQYAASAYDRETIVRLNDELLTALSKLIHHCHESSAVAFTPSDFPEAGLDQENLARLLGQLKQE